MRSLVKLTICKLSIQWSDWLLPPVNLVLSSVNNKKKQTMRILTEFGIFEEGHLVTGRGQVKIKISGQENLSPSEVSYNLAICSSTQEYHFTSSWRCLWCNGYRHRNWTRRHEFKSWTILIAFHISLIPLGKVWIQLFSLRLWVNSKAD